MKRMRMAVAAFVLGAAFCATARGETGQLWAGTAKISITPETDEPIHDPVFARSLVLEVNNEKWAFISADLAVFTSENVEKQCKDQYGLTKVFICSTHNHTAPSKPGKGEAYHDLKAFFERQLVQVVGMAMSNTF